MHEACDDKVAARLREEMIPSLKMLQRIVRFTNTGYWMSIEHADDPDVMWPKRTGLLFELLFGQFLNPCNAHPFEHDGRLYHKTIPRTSNPKINLIHIGVKFCWPWAQGVTRAHTGHFGVFPFTCLQALTTMIIPKKIISTQTRSQ